MASQQQITSTDIAQRPDVYIEPGTGPSILPYRPNSDNGEYGDLSVEIVGDDPSVFPPNGGYADYRGETLDAPDFLTIISQTPRINPDGVTVMDLVLQVGDVLGATSYELRFVT